MDRRTDKPSKIDRRTDREGVRERKGKGERKRGGLGERVVVRIRADSGNRTNQLRLQPLKYA